jgi:hypothetical protein
MKYEIWGHRRGENGQTLLCRVGTNPEPVAQIFRDRRVFLGKHQGKKKFGDMYSNIEVREVADG